MRAAGTVTCGRGPGGHDHPCRPHHDLGDVVAGRLVELLDLDPVEVQGRA